MSNNSVIHYTDLMGLDFTAALALTIHDCLKTGSIIDHPMMTICVSSEALAKAEPTMFARIAEHPPGVFARLKAEGREPTSWRRIAEMHHLSQVCEHLAQHTAPTSRYAMMVDLIDSLSPVNEPQKTQATAGMSL